jgi:hypothetical protein
LKCHNGGRLKRPTDGPREEENFKKTDKCCDHKKPSSQNLGCESKEVKKKKNETNNNE